MPCEILASNKPANHPTPPTVFSNPLVMAASVSKSLRNAEADRPMHRTRLRSLQNRIDDLTIEVRIRIVQCTLQNVAIVPVLRSISTAQMPTFVCLFVVLMAPALPFWFTCNCVGMSTSKTPAVR